MHSEKTMMTPIWKHLKRSQLLAAFFSTNHVFVLIKWRQEEINCQMIKLRYNILKPLPNDGKTAISSSSSFGSTKGASKGIFQSISFPLSNQVQSVQTEGPIYLHSKAELWRCFFSTVDKRANIMTVARLKRKSLRRCTQFEGNDTDT